MDFLKLFFQFIKIGAFSFGGGFSTLPYIYEMKSSWISKEYIENILTVSQVTPGPFACNIATLVGLKNYGFVGAFFCNFGFILPAIICMGICFKFVEILKNNERAKRIITEIRASALAIMIVSSLSLFKSSFWNENFKNLKECIYNINIKALVLGVVIFFISKNEKINSVVIMILTSIIGVIIKL